MSGRHAAFTDPATGIDQFRLVVNPADHVWSDAPTLMVLFGGIGLIVTFVMQGGTPMEEGRNLGSPPPPTRMGIELRVSLALLLNALIPRSQTVAKLLRKKVSGIDIRLNG